MAVNSVFKNVRAYKPGRTAFDLSRSHDFDCDAGCLIPVWFEECVPGDTFKLANRVLVRMAPMVAPAFMSWRVATWTFFVPNRLMMPEFDQFISGGRDGEQVFPVPVLYPHLSSSVTQFNVAYNHVVPSLTGSSERMTGFCNPADADKPFILPRDIYKWSFWDYAGFPMPLMTGKKYQYHDWDTFFQYPYVTVSLESQSSPTFWPYSAYLFVYNEYFRDENLEDRFVYAPTDPNQAHFFPYDQGFGYYVLNSSYIGDSFVAASFPTYRNSILTKCWNKDYFTSALPFQQRGVAPAIPLSGISNIDFDLPDGVNIGASDMQSVVTATSETNTNFSQYSFLDASKIGTITVSDLRDIFQTQKWLERNARSGIRYKEFLHAHFGVSPRDERLQRPEFVGGTNSPIAVTQVLQTSATSGDQALGDYAGYGFSADSTRIGTYYCEEYGWLMTLLCIYPDVTYNQGIHPRYTRRSKLDYFFPEFVNLSEQAVFTRELYVNLDSTSTAQSKFDSDSMIFGYQGRYNEFRSVYNQVSGSMRDDSLGYYVIRRDFDRAPTLEPSFVHMQPEKLRGIFAVQSQPPFIVDYAQLVRAVRPMPYIPEPGLIDHH